MAVIVACDDTSAKRITSFESMGTVVHVEPSRYASLVQEIFERVESEMSEWKDNSPLTLVNNSAGKSEVACPDRVLSAVQTALSIAEMTDGAFDPTWASIWHLWDFTKSNVPTKMEVSRLLPLINWKNIRISGQLVSLKKEGMLLGLGGIAKGIALHEARDALIAEGVADFMLQVGGQVLVHGSERVIGIRKPDGSPNELIGTVTLKDTSVSTSGDYEKFFIVDGVRYHHIIDPSTGFPARGVNSVTVVTNDASIADALSTALMVMGVTEGMALVEDLHGVEALFIDDSMALYLSTGFDLDAFPF
jgi:FAD:protein FMN transferase